MIDWLSHTLDARVFFPKRLSGEDGAFSPEFVAEYIARYTDPETGWATVHWDDAPVCSRRRNASFPNGDIVPDAHDGNGMIVSEEHGEIVGHSFRCGWHPQFLADVANPPESDGALFEGVRKVPTEEQGGEA